MDTVGTKLKSLENTSSVSFPDWLTDGSVGLPGERQFISHDKGSTSKLKEDVLTMAKYSHLMLLGLPSEQIK